MSTATSTSTPTRPPRPPPAPQSGPPEQTASTQLQRPDSDSPTQSQSQSQLQTASNPPGDALQPAGPRRSSFNFLRRKSSSENRNGQRSTSGGKMSKKQKALAQEEALRRQREAAMLPKQPPQLPSHSPLPQINTFGGEDARPDSVAIISNKAGNYNPNFSRPSVEQSRAPTTGTSMPPIPGSSSSYMDFDPYPRTESMAHRGRYSYASSAVSTVNSPRRVRRRKDPTPFNILVIGTKSCGKSSFIEFLRSALTLPAKKRTQTNSPPSHAITSEGSFTSEYLETEVDSERVGVTLWDSEGLDKSIIDFQLRRVTSFLESKFEDTFTEEQKVMRAPGVRDTHIHCVFLVLDPARLESNVIAARKRTSQKMTGQVIGGLDDDLDLNVLRELQGKTTVIPVISKADTITAAHMRHLKKMVWDTIKRAKLDPLEALNLADSDSEDEDLLDERDEDELIESSDAEGTSGVINNIMDKSSSEAGSEDEGSHSAASRSPPTSPPSAKRNHARKPSAMSASIQNEDSETPYLPLSIISPDPYESDFVGRKFAWGFADPYNAEHCDFVRLRESVFGEWRSELREASRERWYEGWRTNRLQRGPSRRIATSDGLVNKQLSLPSANGRAASAGSREYRQPQVAGY